jgi:large subunit ribosomal protein L19
MRNPLFDVVQNKHKRQSELDFEIGDTVVVTIRIIEGEKERLQDFEGTVIGCRGDGLNEMFTVRRIVGDQGVERVFPIHSPKVVSIKTKRSGKVRRCKLYYLRARVGKSRKLKERRISAVQRKAAEEARLEKRRREGEAAATAAAARSHDAAAADREVAATT